MHFLKPVFKISSDLVHSEMSYEFFVRSKMLDRRRKSNFLISLANGLRAMIHARQRKSADSVATGHPIADIDRQRPIL